MRRFGNSVMVLLLWVPLAVAFHLATPSAQAQPTFFSARGCIGCHDTAAATCAGCHHHSGTLSATTNKTSYAPGETVTVTLTASGARAGWIGARLHDQSGAEIARSTGSESGMGSSTTYPAVLSAPAPATPGSYTWKMAYFGNEDGTGSGDVHSEKSANVTFTVAAAPAADTTPPVVGFSLPATATSLTVPVTLSATDNVAVTGYQITTTSTPPAASDPGWAAKPPTGVSAVAGKNTFLAWAKDAAGNVSTGKSATVTVTLPDTTPPVVDAFTVPATATGLSIPVTALSATDNIGVTGYLVTTSSSTPAASAAGWTAAPPAVVTAPAAGAANFYAWARDAAGNVSASKSAKVTVTLPTPTPTADTTKPTLTVSTLPNGAVTNKVTLNVSGTASDAGGLKSVTVNAQPVVVTAAGTFSGAVDLVSGTNPIAVVATDKAGNQTTDTRTVTYDPAAPLLTITAPADNTISAKPVVNVTGTVNEDSTVSVKVNTGTAQPATMTGKNFSATVNLAAGLNTITISATDLAGNVTSAKRTATYTAAKSQINLSVTKPAQDVTTSRPGMMIQGTVTNTGAIKLTVQVDGRTYAPKVAANGTFSQAIKLPKKAQKNVITVKATDASGNSVTVIRNVIYRPGRGERDQRQREHYDD